MPPSIGVLSAWPQRGPLSMAQRADLGQELWQQQRDRLEAYSARLEHQLRSARHQGAANAGADEAELQARQQQAADQARRADDFQNKLGELAGQARKAVDAMVERLRQIAEQVHQGIMAIIRNF